MKINICALLAASIALVSLFYPWLSFSSSGLNSSQSFLNVFLMTYSPLRETGSCIVFSTTSSQTLGYDLESYSPKPFLDRSWVTVDMYFLSVTVLASLFIFAAALMIHVSFASGSWSRVGRKIAIATSNLSFLTIFLYLLVVCRFIEIGGQDLNGGQNGWVLARTMGQSFVPFLDIGFWLAILGTMAAYASWLHPTFISLGTKAMVGKFDAFKRWLPVTEWGKILTILVSSFLPIFIFLIFYLPLV